MKMIACIFVVSIHTNVFWDTVPFLNDLICQGFARLAVPLFFIASAFFFFRGESGWKKTGKYCLRICKLYLCWFIVTIPIMFYSRFFNAKGTIAEKLLSFFRKFMFSSTFEGS